MGERPAILFIEDVPDDVELALRDLRRAGIDPEWRRVQTYEDLELALRERVWDVALLDYTLPGFSAIAALRLVQEHDPDLPVIVLSGTVGEDVAVETMRIGAADYVLKDNRRRLPMAVSREIDEAVARRKRRLTEAELHLSQQRYGAIYDQAPVGVFVFDRDLCLIEANERLGTIIGTPSETMNGCDLCGLLTARAIDVLTRALEGKGGTCEGRWLANGDDAGDDPWAALRASPLMDADGAIVGGIGVVVDLSERRRLLARIRKLAYRDRLTDLANRVLLRDRLKQALANALRDGVRVAVAHVDVDGFRQINEVYGRDGGDRVLRRLAGRLRRTMRSTDTVARVGADEFAIVFPTGDDIEATVAVADKLLTTIREPFRLGGDTVHVRACLGVAVYPDDANDRDTLVRCAESAMRLAKAAGGNRWQLYDRTASERALDVSRLEARLHSALSRHEIVPYYQPIVDAANGTIVSLEALARWIDPERGLVPPFEFIGPAERNGLIMPLGQQVLHDACVQVTEWRSAGCPDLRVSVNLSARQFRQRDLLDMIAETLTETGLPPAALQIEITESVAMDDVEYSREVLGSLRDIGVSSVLDDFGTGYSSLSRLGGLPLDTLKIDRSFVSAATDGGAGATIVRAIIGLGHELGLTVVAEGVETEDQMAFVAEHGCDLVQGYLMARPAPALDVPALLAAPRLPL